nr:MAG TPA: hypothetical protein [Caudoviricetes sp.]
MRFIFFFHLSHLPSSCLFFPSVLYCTHTKYKREGDFCV